MVWCTRWVAVCDREIARRRVTSISAKPASPARTSPRTTRAWCTIRPGHRLLHVEHLDLAAADGDQPEVGLLAAALGVERGGVEHQLDRLALPRRLDRDAGRRRAAPGPATRG